MLFRSFDTTQMAVAAAAEGLGVALGPPEYFAEELESGRLIQPFDIYIETEDAYHLVCPTGRAEEPKIAAFKNWILDEAAKAEAEKTNAPRTRSRARGAA